MNSKVHAKVELFCLYCNSYFFFGCQFYLSTVVDLEVLEPLIKDACSLVISFDCFSRLMFSLGFVEKPFSWCAMVILPNRALF